MNRDGKFSLSHIKQRMNFPSAWRHAGIVVVLFFAFLIRAHNAIVYKTWWGDDGDAHIKYIEYLLYAHRLPSMQENYLAWHEPGYYLLMAGWAALVDVVSMRTQQLLAWKEGLQVGIGILFVYTAYLLARRYGSDRWVSLMVAFLCAVLFPFVKLSAYLNNELLAQAAIVGLAALFIEWKLFRAKKEKYVFFFGILLGIALWIKVTVILVCFAAMVLWAIESVVRRQRFPLVYMVIAFATATIVYSPWLYYKHQHFGHAFSINIYEQEHKQSVLESDAWTYLFEINTSVILTNPYWVSKPYSFVSFLFADTFSDFSNRFTYSDALQVLPDAFSTASRRFTTPELLHKNLFMNRIGLGISFVWIVGVVGAVWQWLRKARAGAWQWNDLFMFILIAGGYAALLYNNLRHPYLERGVLKASFIAFVYPFIALVAYHWWRNTLRNTWLFVVITFFPLLLYALVGWPVLLVQW